VLDPRERQWARLLDAWPAQLGRVLAWTGGPAPRGEGHLHHIPTLAACLAGVVRVEGPLGRCDLAPGEVLLIGPGVWHLHAPLRAGSVGYFQGFLHACSDLVLADADGMRSCGIPTQPSRLLIDRALAAGDDGARREAMQALIDQVLREDLRPIDLFAHPAMAAMLRALWRGLHSGVTAADLQRASWLGRSRAWQVFGAAYGTSPLRAIAEARLELAAGLLAAGLGAAETARRCGYPSRRELARAWRRRHGAPPGRRP
jgi:AraC-like DNA-binding protein